MRVTAVRRHIQPIILGIVIGSFAGLFLAIPGLVTTGYLKHRLYYSISRVLLDSINTYVLAACIAAYVFHIGRMLKGRLSFVVCFAAVVGFLGFVGIRFGLDRWLSKNVLEDLNMTYVQQFFVQGFPQILACVVLIGAGTVWMRRMRRAGAMEANVDGRTEPDSHTEPAVIRRNTLLDSASLSAVVFIAFLGLNFVPTLLRAKNVHDVNESPNIIYIMVDSLRADHLGCYGYSRNTSPNIDMLAEEGLRFDRAISQAPWTTASVSSFMSSRYLRMGLGTLAAVPSNVVLMPELLKDRGYVTGAVISNDMAGSPARLSRGYDHYYEMTSGEVNTVQGKHAIPSTVFSKSLKMLKEMKGRRFFMFTLFMGPHSPYAAHKEHDFTSGYKGKLSRDGVFVEQCHYKGDDLRYAEGLYDGEIAYTDRYIGLLIAELKKLNLYDNTLIVLLADHGEEFEEHGKMSHGEHLYDESIHVPLIVKLPGQKEGGVVKGGFPLINLLPSIAKYINCDTSSLEFQGTAVQLADLRSVRETNIYSSTEFGQKRLQSLRSGSSKLIVDLDASKAELYDLRHDPGEKRDIAADSPETISEFQSALESMNSRIDDALKNVVMKPFSAEEAAARQKSMRALGYLQ